MLNHRKVYGPDRVQEFVPADEGTKFGDLTVWVTKDPYIQVRVESEEQIKVADYSLICTVVVGDETAICLSSKFSSLPKVTKEVLLNREYLRYSYTRALVNCSYRAGESLALSPENDYCDDPIIITGSSKEMEFRIMSQLYATYGKWAVDKAVQVASSYKVIDKLAMAEYKAGKKMMRQLAMKSVVASIKAKFTPSPAM